ncbi:protein arginine methyltransferase NDUFAF7, mitochondrial isoform X1 [Polypterus senegalus]|nr:protein arginine methyltransferase NDUFAF7, mitochondrial isoform X1 [Polypterus senegalus]
MRMLKQLQKICWACQNTPYLRGTALQGIPYYIGRKLCTEWSKSQGDQCQSLPMLKHLVSKIKSTGPISVAEYMREVLTNPVSGYYIKNNMLGAKGDFITSPEISQMFGEMLGIWCVSEWMAAGKPEVFQIVEFGPGSGSLASDVLRVFGQLTSVLGKTLVSVHLIEVSPVLSNLQAEKLTGKENLIVGENVAIYRQGITSLGLPVYWHRSLEDVPREFSVFLAHEFFDALPIHKFQKTDKGWREVLVDIDTEQEDKLRFVLAPSATLASSFFLKTDEGRMHIEVCPEAGILVQRLTSRISEDGGAALIADYGHDGEKEDTFRGFSGHKPHDALMAPGTADLTADVDFCYLRRMTEGKVASLGPVAQCKFLENMGINVRLQVLMRNSTDSDRQAELVHGFDMMMNPKKMGERFKFFALLPHSRLANPEKGETDQKRPKPPPVAGFTELEL